MITVKKVQVTKSRKLILDIEKIDFKDVKSIGIFGENGAGKTTFVKCLLGIEEHVGNIEFNFENRNMQVIMQNNNYPFFAKVRDVISLVLDIPNLDNIYDFVKHINFEDCMDKYINFLSEGEKQKLNLVLILNLNPSLIIIDEVTTGLDHSTRKKIIKYIKEFIKSTNCRLIVISHYIEELEELTNEVMIMKDGKIVCICKSCSIRDKIGEKK